MELKYLYNDGGRSKYFKGNAGDCVVRAIAIATSTDYKIVYDELYQANKEYLASKKTKVAKRMKSATPRNGNFKTIYKKYLISKGWEWVTLKKFGSTERTKLDALTHLKTPIIVSVNRHLLCMINGTVNDTWDSRYSFWEETKSVKTAHGYFINHANKSLGV